MNILGVWQEAHRQVVAVQAPLPPATGDRERDAAACRAILEPLLQAYVRRFPEQCRYLAFGP